MTRKFLAILIGLSARGLMTPPLFAQQLSTPVKLTNTERMNFAPGGVIRIDDSYGELNVEGWDQPEVEITVIKTMPYDYNQSEATKHVKGVEVMTKRMSDNELVISTTLETYDSLLSSTAKTKGDVWLEYQIHVPHDTKLVIHHGAGTVHVTNIAADVEATGSRGDIVLMLREPGSYSIDAKTTFGTIASDFGGNAHRYHFVGRSFATGNTPASHRIYVRMGYGGITVKTLPKEAYPPSAEN
jgi:Putative adhesin